MATRKKVLVAGATGLVGAAAMKHFAGEPGCEVLAVSRRAPMETFGARWKPLDLSDTTACAAMAVANQPSLDAHRLVPELEQVVRRGLHVEHADVAREVEGGDLFGQQQGVAGLIDRDGGNVPSRPPHGPVMGGDRKQARSVDVERRQRFDDHVITHHHAFHCISFRFHLSLHKFYAVEV